MGSDDIRCRVDVHCTQMSLFDADAKDRYCGCKFEYEYRRRCKLIYMRNLCFLLEMGENVKKLSTLLKSCDVNANKKYAVNDI